MPQYIVTYDVKKPHHSAVKNTLLENGFRDYINAPSGKNRQLPNTTLAIDAMSTKDAKALFLKCVTKVASGILERFILLSGETYSIRSEEVDGDDEID
ncbi:hypothetical protein HUA78_30455 [Myxococcus sp. CA033]|uniref:hypothetical protein n=1 Tax=Myxococcus sp. CA033 TaxID=2741516 RepID=UPI00157B1DF8|nr:hypothetical protein [Myxococcus sp. CA033]NTX38775.1 hypothetical protein [Myxococcus sp. CA033]